MRLAVIIAPLLLLTLASAAAQAPIVATPLPPIGAPGDVPTPAAPATLSQPAPPPQNVWLPRGTALVQTLDKVNARGAVLTIKVGQSATYGSLTIAVKGCVVRPPDQPADAAAFLSVTDKTADAPGFSGWMLHSNPALSMMEHPIYDLRVTGCAS